MSLIVVFHNDSTGTLKIGNYDVQVYINDDLIGHMELKGHKRKLGWQQLVRDFAASLATTKTKGLRL